MTCSRWWVGVAVAAIASLAPVQAQAFVRSVVRGTEICLFWNDREIPWSLNEKGSADLSLDEVDEALRRSFATWEAVDCSDMRFAEAGTTAAAGVGFSDDGENLVVFRTTRCSDVVDESDPCWDDFSCSNLHGCWAFGDGVIAVTTTSYREDTGEIVDADIEFNDARYLFTTASGRLCERGQTEGCISTDLQNTATHEIGHLLGIDHSPVAGSTMYASAPQGETSKRSLARDDIDAICTIYPLGQPPNVCEDAYGLRRNDGGGCNCGQADGLALLGLLPALARVLRRRPRG